MKKSTAALLLLLGVLIGAPVWVGLSAIATDISTSDWSETDASNNQTAPAGFPEGMAPSGVNNAARAVMGAVKRFWNRANATVTSSGSSGVYALSYTVAPSTYINGETYSFRANHTNGSTGASLNISSLGARTLAKPSTNGLVAVGASDIASGNHVSVQYDSATNQFAIVGGLSSSAAVTAGDGIAISGSTVSLGVNTLTTLSSPATNDDLPIYDTSASAHRRISLVDLLSIVNSLTEETSVQAATDFVPMYDSSSGAIRKVKPQNLAGVSVALQAITADGTYTPTSGMKYCIVFATGGGGGGGSSGNAGGAGGGGAGGTAIGVFSAATIGASQAVDIGAGGAATAAGANTTFGVLLTGNGGSAGGNPGSAATSGAGGSGGTASSGTLNITGGDGDPGTGSDNATYNGSGGSGGGAMWGSGGKGAVTTASTNGGAGNAYGGGGGGSSNGGTGGAGKAGVVFVIEFL